MALPSPGTPPPPAPGRTPFLALVLMLVAVVLCAGAIGVTDLVHLATGHRGTATMDSCTFAYTTKGKRTWTCTATFVADDGALRVPGVRYTSTTEVLPGDTRQVTVSGPGATEADDIGYLSIPITMTVTAVALVGLVLLVVRRRRAAPRVRRGTTRRT